MPETAPNELLQTLPFALYERYCLLGQIARLLFPTGSTYRVLDVGGHTPPFWPGFSSLAGALIPHAQVTVADVQPTAQLENYVSTSGALLPFRDGTFDLVCSLDTLEHTPSASRQTFLRELLRVSRDALYIAFPFDSSANQWAESLIREYTCDVLQLPLPALQEHRQFGLPGRDVVNGVLASTGYSWTGFVQGNTDVWVLMMLTYHALRLAGAQFIENLNRGFNRLFAPQDWSEPGYRAAYIVSKTRGTDEIGQLKAELVPLGKGVDLLSLLSYCRRSLEAAKECSPPSGWDPRLQRIEAALASVIEVAQERGDGSGQFLRLRLAELVPSGSKRPRASFVRKVTRFFERAR
ncbi:MAG: methyltransferase domain-containing protein [Bryobacteraceae bacterium]